MAVPDQNTQKKLDMKIDDLTEMVSLLAISVKEGFDSVDERFAKMEHKFNNRFDKVDKQLFELNSDMVDVKKSIKNFEKGNDRLKERVDYHHDKINEIDNRVKMVERAIAKF